MSRLIQRETQEPTSDHDNNPHILNEAPMQPTPSPANTDPVHSETTLTQNNADNDQTNETSTTASLPKLYTGLKVSYKNEKGDLIQA